MSVDLGQLEYYTLSCLLPKMWLKYVVFLFQLWIFTVYCQGRNIFVFHTFVHTYICILIQILYFGVIYSINVPAIHARKLLTKYRISSVTFSKHAWRANVFSWSRILSKYYLCFYFIYVSIKINVNRHFPSLLTIKNFIF